MTMHLTISIEGMSCANCSGRIERALGATRGVLESSVNLTTRRASLDIDPTVTNAADIFKVIEEVGFEPQSEQLEFGVSGMTCVSCVKRVERAIEKLPGIIEVSVNLATQRTRINFLTNTITGADIKSAIVDAGYGTVDLEQDASGEDHEREARVQEIASLRHDVIFAAAFTIPLFSLAMIRMIPSVETVMLSLLSHTGWIWIELLLAS
ncbi:MAG: copper ion binding protein, partial [Rhodospirillales bacterium]|nr:copper ion binding protein [Rhodospirillales bacterium]